MGEQSGMSMLDSLLGGDQSEAASPSSSSTQHHAPTLGSTRAESKVTTFAGSDLMQKHVADLSKEESDALADAIEAHLEVKRNIRRPFANHSRKGIGARRHMSMSTGENEKLNTNSHRIKSLSFMPSMHYNYTNDHDDGDSDLKNEDVPGVVNYLKSLESISGNSDNVSRTWEISSETTENAKKRHRVNSSVLETISESVHCCYTHFCCQSPRCLCKVISHKIVGSLSNLSTSALTVLLNGMGVTLFVALFLITSIRSGLSTSGQFGHAPASDPRYSPGANANTTVVYNKDVEALDIIGAGLAMALLVFVFILLLLVGKTITKWKAWHLWVFYCLTVAMFGVVYRYMIMIDAEDFILPIGWSVNNASQMVYNPFINELDEAGGFASQNQVPSSFRVLILFFYFSMTTQTSVGFGDIVPESMVVRVIAAFQMFLGLAFGSMLLGLTSESDMQLLLGARHRKLTLQMRKLVAWREQNVSRAQFKKRQALRRATVAQQSDNSCKTRCRLAVLDSCVGCCFDYDEKLSCSFLSRCVNNGVVVRVRRFLRSFLLTLTVVTVYGANALITMSRNSFENTQQANVTKNAEFYYENLIIQDRIDNWLFAFIAIVHLALLVVIIGTSMKFVRKTEQVTVQFLCNAFLATCTLFGSLYTLLSLWDPDSFSNTRDYFKAALEKSFSGKTSLAEILFRYFGVQFVTFQYYSITTMTTTGFGFVTPHSSFAQIVVMCQELLSVLFAQIVLGVGIQSVAVKLEMKKDPKKFDILNTATIEENIKRLMSNSTKFVQQSRIEEGKDVESQLPDDTTFRMGEKSESKPLNFSRNHFETNRARSSTECMEDLMLRISELEKAMN